MNNIKNKKRARISHENLDHCLRVVLSNTKELDFEKLVDTVQSQDSHYIKCLLQFQLTTLFY